LKISRAQAAGGVAQVGECLPSKRKALISKPILTKRKKREREREREREKGLEVVVSFVVKCNIFGGSCT
jgi:hypothetical protein